MIDILPSLRVGDEDNVALRAGVADTIGVLGLDPELVLRPFYQLAQRRSQLATRGSLEPHVPPHLVRIDNKT